MTSHTMLVIFRERERERERDPTYASKHSLARPCKWQYMLDAHIRSNIWKNLRQQWAWGRGKGVLGGREKDTMLGLTPVDASHAFNLFALVKDIWVGTYYLDTLYMLAILHAQIHTHTHDYTNT